MMHAPASLVTSLYSAFRPGFLKAFAAEQPRAFVPPASLSRELWGIRFRAPIFNAAGMFKNGEAYRVVAAQGAGAWLCGTTTALPRMGNTKRGVTHPFVPYPRSGSASNWMGLPNRGHAAVASIVSKIDKVDGCPLGASLSSDPDQHGRSALESLAEGLHMYVQAGVDFMELNESCPNVPGHENDASSDALDPALIQRLEYVAEHFLRKRTRFVPLIVKLSNDTDPQRIPALVDVLLSLGYEGITLGNTSTRYAEHGSALVPAERRVFDYFKTHFGGGMSGRILHSCSLNLSRIAAQHAHTAIADGRFQVIRCGGVESRHDLLESEQAGIALCEWYTGYFEAFSAFGHRVYEELLSKAL